MEWHDATLINTKLKGQRNGNYLNEKMKIDYEYWDRCCKKVL